MTRNRELFYKVADHIERYPERYDQKKWGTFAVRHNGSPSIMSPSSTPKSLEVGSCGSVGCIAGTTCALEGAIPSRFTFLRGSKYSYYAGDWEMVTPAEHVQDAVYHSPHRRFSSEYAAELLGLSAFDAQIFRGDWLPPEDMTVAEALRKFGDGAELRDITDPEVYRDFS